MSNLFIVSTHYQLINAINIVCSFYGNEKNDLIIFKINDKCEELNLVANKANLFNKINIIDIGSQYENNKFKYARRRMAFIRKVKDYIVNPNCYYDWIYIAGTEIFSKAIFHYYYKKNKQTKLAYFEDGTGSYSYLLVKKNRKLNKLFLKLVFGYESNKKCLILYVYEPQLVYNDYKNISIQGMPKIKQGSNVYNILKNCYSDFKNGEEIQSKDIILLDGNWAEKWIADKQSAYFSKIIQDFPKTIVRLHPSSEKNKYGKNVDYWNSRIGFEMDVLLNDLHNQTLVSVFSTASIVPALVFDANIKSIYLYKLVDPQLNRFSISDQFVEKINSNTNYKVFVPTTEEELLEYLEKEYCEK